MAKSKIVLRLEKLIFNVQNDLAVLRRTRDTVITQIEAKIEELDRLKMLLKDE